MTRKEQIKSAYRLTGGHAGFYDGMMTCSTFPEKAICRMVWNMDGDKNLRYLEKALSGIPEVFSGSNKTIWNIFWSANNYPVPKQAPTIPSKIQFWVGDEEWSGRYRDLKWYREYLPQIEVVTIPHSMHGEFVMMHPNKFAAQAGLLP